MNTLPREPWRGGQICGWQVADSLPGSGFCGEFKAPGSPLCEAHDKELRAEHGGLLPKFAKGNARGLALYRRTEQPYLFKLAWEPYRGGTPIPATPDDVLHWQQKED